jgi:hypothetical protein
MRRIDRHRETFITALLKRVPTATRADALRLLRWGRTYGRLAEARRNGDWPAGGITTCTRCESQWEPAACRGFGLVHECPSCRAERIIRETCEAINARTGMRMGPCVPEFQGDPRGYAVRLAIAGEPRDAYDRAALAVPTS